jgi:hypothetical protein
MAQQVEKDRDSNPLVPGALYCAVIRREDGRTGEEYDSHEGLYWYSSDGDFYGYGGILGEDSDEPAYPDYDYLVRQDGAFDKSYVWEVAA